ncbi:SMI1/KNR4 family protein [Aquibacillus koreensis]|uniref:SMI1/KNR4 family protein n=1 Tax=Aquibacillus koreensis TaxID=279446 RepID=A0A9X3WNQ2_9BACI|nr:SMI1/KNR4 family protein [Aquibacillus koreensis]MCT2536708.1 SMI1/KNR4 family protein [Aquibacillus koreensis]MDC3421536.1 SMI1/KNR4 family protein [Aquibacillus koreensis]
MLVDEFIRKFNKKFPDVDKFDYATDQMISEYEDNINYKLPASFKKFLKNFSNGIFLLDCEPIGGVSKDSPCGDICKVTTIIPDVPEKVLLFEKNEYIDSKKLVSFTMYDSSNISNNHWVFICNEGIPNNEYRVGFISESSNKIVKVLSTFEEWLTIFWENNNDLNEMGEPVFNSFFQILKKD